jgi:hypothetical protein
LKSFTDQVILSDEYGLPPLDRDDPKPNARPSAVAESEGQGKK